MDKAKFYDALRRRNSGVFGSRLSPDQVRGMEGILDAFVTHGDGSAKTLAYALATAYHETARRMVPVREGLARTDAGARRAVNALARRRGAGSAVARYAQPTGPYSHVYYGRGHVQLTWLDNYMRSSADAGTDLVKNPDAMLDPIISARVLFKGLLDGRWNGRSKGLAFYLDRDDLKGARRTVNVTDKWSAIAAYYQAFFKAILEAGGIPIISTPQRPTQPVPIPPPPDIPKPDDTPPQPPQSGFFHAFMQILRRLFT